jgi:hypothetical protein
MLLTHFPESAGIWYMRFTLEEQGRATANEWSIDNEAMTDDPADVTGSEVD